MGLADTLVEKTAEILHRYSMVATGDRIGVAVSGGADSVALLHLLNRLAGTFKIELSVLHINHHLRGLQSDADEEFVRKLADSLGWPVLVGEGMGDDRNEEAAARQARRTFWEKCRQSYELRRIAVGHNRSDQAETVLHRVLRGSGSSGLAAMPFVSRDGLIRPLLAISREEIRRWAKEAGLAWREDLSNQDLRFTRNRLRQTTLPSLTHEYNPNLECALAGTAELAQAEEDYWKREVEQLYPHFTKRTRLGVIFAVEALLALHLAVRRRLVRRALTEVRTQALRGLDFEHIEAILKLCESTQGHNRTLIPGADALRSFDSLLLCQMGRLNSEPREYSLEVALGGRYELPFGAGEICIGCLDPKTGVCVKFKEDRELEVEQVRLNGEALMEGPLQVRSWQPGDELHRQGHRTAEKVKTLFQEQRIVLWERRHWPVLLCKEEVAWVRGFGVAERFAETERNSHGVELVYRTVSQNQS